MLDFLRRIFRRHKTTGAVVVKRQLAPRTKLLIVSGVGAIVVAGVLFIYDHGLSMAGFERGLATRQQQKVEEDNTRLGDENQQLREALARAERTVQIAQVSYEDLAKKLETSDQDNIKLREEVNFYRNIISPADKKGGLRIQSLDVQSEGRGYRYKLVLIQALRHDHIIYGSAVLEISGTQDGQNAVVKVPSDRSIPVNLKYFQDIEGKFDLPKGFKPRSIKANVTTNGGGPAVEALYDWPQV